MLNVYKKGFSLAEIVIAVAVIGIVSSLTITTYFANSNFQKNKYVAGLKKAYAELDYATTQIKAHNSGTVLGAFDDSPFSDDFRDLYEPYLKVRYKCNYGINTGCWHANNVVKNINGTISTNDMLWSSKLVLNDGTLITFVSRGADCTYSYFGVTQICAEVRVDVNGFKPPNQLGRDIHFFYINRTGVKPVVYTNGGIFNCSISDNYSTGCAAKILKEGKMMY